MSFRQSPLGTGDEDPFQLMLVDEMRRKLEAHQKKIDELIDASGMDRKAFEDLMIAYVADVLARQKDLTFDEAIHNLLFRNVSSVLPEKKEEE